MKIRYGISLELPTGAWEKTDLELEEHDIEQLFNMDGWTPGDRAHFAMLSAEQLTLAMLIERHSDVSNLYRARLATVSAALQKLKIQ